MIERKNHCKKAKILIAIPLITFVVAVVCFVIALILEVPTDRGSIYALFGLIGLLSLFLAPFPCLIISIAGTIQAVKARKNGEMISKFTVVLGIVEIIASVVLTFLATYLFITGQSV